MARSREIMRGRRDQFAVKVAFLPDPDNGRAATPEYSTSWGSLEIWVHGHNLCQHIEYGEPIESVHWYLLPLLQWLASNWDFLLHEERMPVKIAARDAWITMLRAADAPPGLSDDAAERWEEARYAWWKRHALHACREGGLLPNALIRRWRDRIELSWGGRPIAGAPEHFRFDAYHGCARLEPSEVVYVLFGVLDEASRHLHEEMPESQIFQQLVDDVAKLRTSDNRRRLGLLSGYRLDELEAANAWESVRSLFPPDIPAEIGNAIFGARSTDLIVEGSCQAALMFGSLAPSIDSDDARLLTQKLVEYFDPNGEAAALRELVRSEAVERTDDTPWDQGYQLAEELYEKLGVRFLNGSSIEIEAMFQHLQISIGQVALHDASIRAVAIAGPQHRPVVLLNSSYEFGDTEPRRFTLAHELCHILHDRSYGAQLALASGPWAPLDVERRANAFAAMLLMPTELLEMVIGGISEPLDSTEAIWQIANTLRTSFVATLEHLRNLGFIDETTRDLLRMDQMNRTGPTSLSA